ncbi:MAG: S1C family serine protease, partial [Nitrospinota bacterium]
MEKKLLVGRSFPALLVLLLLLIPSLAASESRLRVLEEAFAAVADRVSPAVVSVVSRGAGRHPRVPGHKTPEGEIPRRGSGTGFIMDKRGYILTNNHVVDGAREVRVVLADDREFEATVVGGDFRSDVAVLKIEAPEELPVVPLGDSDKIHIGQWAIAIGNPFGLARTVTVGVISGVGRSGLGVATYENFIQTDASISPGNSGGPLLNLKGEVIGVNTAIFSRASGIGFAIPINMARRVARQLISQGRVVRGFLGVIIQPLTSELARKFGMKTRKGALVGDLLEGGPAERSGIQRGDIILRFDGQEVENVAHLQ